MTLTEMDAEIAALDRRLAALRADRTKMADSELLRLAHLSGDIDAGLRFFEQLVARKTQAELDAVFRPLGDLPIPRVEFRRRRPGASQ